MAEGKFRFSLRQLFLLMTLACLAFFFVPKVATLVLLTMAWGLACSSVPAWFASGSSNAADIAEPQAH